MAEQLTYHAGVAGLTSLTELAQHAGAVVRHVSPLVVLAQAQLHQSLGEQALAVRQNVVSTPV